MGKTQLTKSNFKLNCCLKKIQAILLTRKKYFLSCCLLVTLFNLGPSACTRTKFTSLSWDSHQRLLQALTSYRAYGSLSYHAPQRKLYTLFSWHQINPEHFIIKFINMLGQTLLQIEYNQNKFKLRDHRNKWLQDTQARNLLQSYINFPIPLERLIHWFIGLPNTDDIYELSKKQKIQNLTFCYNKQSVKVHYLSYYEKKMPILPEKMELCFDEQKIILKINEWKIL